MKKWIWVLMVMAVVATQAQGQGIFVDLPGVTVAPSGNGLLDGLIAYYAFDEANATDHAVDSHSGGRTLTAASSTPVVAGVLNNARSFTKANDVDYFSRASEAAFTFGSGDFTITMWWKPGEEPLTADHDIIAKWDFDGGASWLLMLDSGSPPGETDPFTFFWSTDGAASSSVYDTAAGGTTDTETYFVAVRRSGGTIKLSATAASSASVEAGNSEVISGSLYDNSGTPVTVGTTMFEGAATTTGDGEGVLDEVGFWSRALSDADLTLLFNGGTPLPYSSFEN